MSKSNEKKSYQLGEPYGTACNKMRKQLMFRLMQECGLDICYRCGGKIDNIDKMSIEHKESWLDSTDPVGLFYADDNICFSHMFCNIGVGRKKYKHPSHGAYKRGCRCAECIAINTKCGREGARRRRGTDPKNHRI